MERRLRLVVFQEDEDRWMARGLEHDLEAEAATAGEAVRALLNLIEAHTAFDIRHDHAPLEAFQAAPRRCWNLYTSGRPVSLPDLGVSQPDRWHITAALAERQLTELDPQYRHARDNFRV